MLRRALQLALGTGVALGLLWTLAAATARGPGGLGAIYVFLLIYALFGVSFLFALWAHWKHTEHRRLARWIMALPVVFGFLPVVIRILAGGAVTGEQLWSLAAVAVAAAALTAWIAPRTVAGAIPAVLVRSRLFNWLLLIALMAAWLFFILVVAYVASEDRSSTTSGTGLAYAVVLASLYLMGLGLGSLGVSTWAWVSLRGGFEATARRLNIAQLCVAAPGILLGVVVAVWAAGQGQ